MGGLRFNKTKEKIVEEILLNNYNQYYRLAYSYVHNSDDASDIVQNGAYKAIRNVRSLKHEEYASTWLYRIMLNEIFTFCKQQKAKVSSFIQIEDATEDSCEDIDLRRALETLSDEERMIVELKYFEDMKLEEITDETNFYLNQDGNIVIAFNEGDVAPMYMGCVEFVIPNQNHRLSRWFVLAL